MENKKVPNLKELQDGINSIEEDVKKIRKLRKKRTEDIKKMVDEFKEKGKGV